MFFYLIFWSLALWYIYTFCLFLYEKWLTKSGIYFWNKYSIKSANAFYYLFQAIFFMKGKHSIIIIFLHENWHPCSYCKQFLQFENLSHFIGKRYYILQRKLSCFDAQKRFVLDFGFFVNISNLETWLHRQIIY